MVVMDSVLDVHSRGEFRAWLEANHATASGCWIPLVKGSRPPVGEIWYLDSVEEALCFGWIDSINKRFEGRVWQRFTPRRRGSVWSELNKERCRRLERLGLMTDAGRAVLPDMSEAGFRIAADIMAAFAKDAQAWANFCAMPGLYRRVRIDTVQRDRSDMARFAKRLDKLLDCCRRGVLFGEWNDHGRLLPG